MMFCHGRGKKKKELHHLSEYSYQVKASSQGGNSHYLIIPEIVQVPGKAWISWASTKYVECLPYSLGYQRVVSKSPNG